MREIKFRVWNGKQFIRSESLWIANSDFGFPYIGANLIKSLQKPWEFNFDSFLNPVIQQFIGLKDKNNKEIYEGDIVKFSYQSYENEKEDVIGEVFFDEGVFYFDRKLTFATNDSNFIKESIEIIGNIFETPELISKCNK